MRKIGSAMVAMALCTQATAGQPANGVDHRVGVSERPGTAMPALGGITPPAGSELLRMDIITKPKPGGASGIYEIRSPLGLGKFGRLYAAAAKRAGYKVSAGSHRLAGVRGDGSAFRLDLYKTASGSSGVLMIRPAVTVVM